SVVLLRTASLRLELLERLQRFSILLRPIQRSSEQKVRVVKEVRLGIGAQESSQDCDGLFGLPRIDKSLLLIERRIVRRGVFGGCSSCSRLPGGVRHQRECHGEDDTGCG